MCTPVTHPTHVVEAVGKASDPAGTALALGRFDIGELGNPLRGYDCDPGPVGRPLCLQHPEGEVGDDLGLSPAHVEHRQLGKVLVARTFAKEDKR